ncbi:PQQ-dependent sugar dehydrogenase [Rhodococcus aerolatus]
MTEEMTGLTKPWDVVELPDGTLLTGERSGTVFAAAPGGPRRQVAFDTTTLYANGETGLMGLELSARFADDRTVYACQGRLADAGGPNRIEVARYTLDAGATALTRTGTVVDGMPTATGRHGGCRVRDLGDGSLVIGTGDAAIGTTPQDRFSLGGKTLRVDAATGAGWPGNPFLGGGGDPRVQSYGHRNVQGLAVRPTTEQLYSVEQGTYRDDEVNLVTAGADYGYNPVYPFGAAGYNETVPMTRPGGTPAVWSSGPSTIATSGAAFTRGAAWGRWADWLAVGVQKGNELMLLQLPADGGPATARVDVLTDRGRLRSVTAAADGSLLVTTDNGGGTDVVLRVTPG